MEDSPILLIMLMIYLIAVFSGGKKKNQKNQKKQRRRGTMRTASQGEEYDRANDRRREQTQRGFAEAFSNVSPPQQEVNEKSCEGAAIHLHHVSQQQMAAAAEGEDPCHAGGTHVRNDVPMEQLEDGEHLLAQDILRGVIMSEILTRPQERAAQRAAWRRNGQGYHG